MGAKSILHLFPSLIGNMLKKIVNSFFIHRFFINLQKKKEMSIIGNFLNMARAYEIAKLGSFSIQVVFDKSYLNGFDDYELIKKYYHQATFAERGDIVVEIVPPDQNHDDVEYEKINDIHKRVQKAFNNEKPEAFESVCRNLLRTATEKLNFSIEKRENVREIAKTIAQLHGSNIVKVEHLAEAIQYNFTDGSDMCNGESQEVLFGHGIKIARTELYKSDIKNAIKYLKKML